MTFTYNKTKVVEYVKSPAGIRKIYLTSDAKRIIANTIEKRIYDYCEAAGISRKSSHEIEMMLENALKSVAK